MNLKILSYILKAPLIFLIFIIFLYSLSDIFSSIIIGLFIGLYILGIYLNKREIENLQINGLIFLGIGAFLLWKLFIKI